jgi:H+/gluconate symporter-like permease
MWVASSPAVLSLPLLLLLMLLLVLPPLLLLLLLLLLQHRLGSASVACIAAWALCWPAVKLATLCKKLLPEALEAGDGPAGRP